MIKVLGNDLASEAIAYSVGKNDLEIVRIIGMALDGVGLETEVDLEFIWKYAEDNYGDDIPQILYDFMEDIYGDKGHAWDFSPELGDELRGILDSIEWPD